MKIGHLRCKVVKVWRIDSHATKGIIFPVCFLAVFFCSFDYLLLYYFGANCFSIVLQVHFQKILFNLSCLQVRLAYFFINILRIEIGSMSNQLLLCYLKRLQLYYLLFQVLKSLHIIYEIYFFLTGLIFNFLLLF